MRRTCVRSLGRRCQTWYAAFHSGIEDQQASGQGDRPLQKQLAPPGRFGRTFTRRPLCSIRQLVKFAKFGGSTISFISVTSGWRSTCIYARQGIGQRQEAPFKRALRDDGSSSWEKQNVKN